MESGLSDLVDVLRCPLCGASLGESLACAKGHHYQRLNGVPQLLDSAAWASDSDIRATATAFGQQWSSLGEAARVNREDLLLHIPTGLDISVFSGRVLDVGCGMGRYTALVADLGALAVGIDVSRSVVKAAEMWPNCVFLQADLLESPFAPRSFDTVYSFGVLHHISDPVRGFQACFDLVKPGGFLITWVYSNRNDFLRVTRRLARVLSRRFSWFTPIIATAAAMSLWLFLLFPARLLNKVPQRLRFYGDKGLRQLYVDCHDALIAPLEVSLSESDCQRWLDAIPARRKAFEKRHDGSGWLIWAQK